MSKTKTERDSTGASMLSEAARLLGRKGAPAAARARFEKMTPEQRSEHGRRLVSKRWDKEKSSFRNNRRS